MEKQVSLNGCYVLSPETQLTISNLASADDNCYIEILLWTLSEYDGEYGLDNLYFYHLTNNGGFLAHQMMYYQGSEYGGPVQLRPGESDTFSISEYATLYDEETGEAFLTYDLLVLSLGLYYPDAGQSWTVYYGFVMGE